MRWTLIAAAAAALAAAAASVLPQFLIAFLSHRACIFSQSAGNVVGLSVSLVRLTVCLSVPSSPVQVSLARLLRYSQFWQSTLAAFHHSCTLFEPETGPSVCVQENTLTKRVLSCLITFDCS